MKVLSAPSALVFAFDEIEESHQELVGGKGFSLGVLTRAGFPVPEGFVLTSRAFAALRSSPVIAQALSALDLEAETLDEAQLTRVREQVLGAGMPADVRAALLAAYRRFFDDRTPLAVRSSGTKEDLEGASFAGQYETLLNVRGEIALELAVKRCWASVWHQRVLGYAANKGGGARDLSMAVVVQRMVPAEIAGVLFTVNPLSGRECETTIESAFGLGEALVSGRVTGDRFVVDPQSGVILERHLGTKQLKTVPDDAGATVEVALDGDAATQATLDERKLAELTELGAAIQEHYGRPMDVEWCYAGGKPYVVQARPITRLSFQADIGEWTTADFKDGGVSSDVCSPFMWSLYEMCFEHSMPAYLKGIKLLDARDSTQWSQMFFARPYWNLGATKRVLESIPGFNERNFDTDLGIVPTYEGAGRTTKVTPVGVARALPVLFALKQSYKDVLAHNRRFVAELPARKAPFDLAEDELRALDRDTFAQRWRQLITELYFETETSYFTTIYNTSNSKLDFKVHFEKANQACGGTLNYLKLMSGLKDLSHLRPLRDLYQLATRLKREGRALDDEAVRAYAERWRHHGAKELDIRVPRYKDDLPFVRQLMQQAFDSHEQAPDPDAQVAQQHATYRAERQKGAEALRLRPLQRRSFLQMLELVRQYAWWREEMRDHSSYLYYLVRMWSVEAARRLQAAGSLAEADDIWYLPFQDALELAEGTLPVAEAQARVRAGRRLVRSFRNFQNPNEIGCQYRGAERAPLASADALRGTGCSPGRIEGRARVVKKLDEMHRVEPGDILVTLFTDPGWTPLFARLAGVVTETGGVLAHAAVISREYGIPAVLAVHRATELIGDGDQIAIEGTAGTVEILRRAS
jgi:pyruvate,water dikinase